MMILVLALSLALRLVNLTQSLWLDEAISVVAVSKYTYWELLTKFLPGDVHPPLYYFLLKFWDGFFGYSEVASRLPSVICNVATTYIVYLIGKRFGGERVAVLGALFWTINPLAVYYSQEARMYSLLTFFVVTAVYFFIVKRWWWFSAAMILAVYTDYLAFLMLPVLWLLATDKKQLLKLGLVVILFYLPWLPIFLNQLRLGTALSMNVPEWGQIVGGLSFKSVGLVWVKFLIGRITFDNKYLYGGILAAITAGYLFILARVRNKFLWTWFILPVFLGAVIAFWVPVFAYHRFLFVLPALMLLLAVGAKKWWMIGLVVLVSMASLIYFELNPRFWREDWRGAAVYAKSTQGTVMMPSLAQDAPLVYYGVNLDQRLLPRVYLFRYVQELFDPRDSKKVLLEGSGYYQIGKQDFNGVVIWTYEK